MEGLQVIAVFLLLRLCPIININPKALSHGGHSGQGRAEKPLVAGNNSASFSNPLLDNCCGVRHQNRCGAVGTLAMAERFVSPYPIREWGGLTYYCSALIRERARKVNQVYRRQENEIHGIIHSFSLAQCAARREAFRSENAEEEGKPSKPHERLYGFQHNHASHM
jgi:hypothetical protein